MELEFTNPVKCYNDAFDSKSKMILDNRKLIFNRIRKVEPEAHITYHHPDIFVVHAWGRRLSDECTSYSGALISACNKLGIL